MSGHKPWKDVRRDPGKQARAALEAEMDSPVYAELVAELGDPTPQPTPTLDEILARRPAKTIVDERLDRSA